VRFVGVRIKGHKRAWGSDNLAVGTRERRRLNLPSNELSGRHSSQRSVGTIGALRKRIASRSFAYAAWTLSRALSAPLALRATKRDHNGPHDLSLGIGGSRQQYPGPATSEVFMPNSVITQLNTMIT